MKVPRPLKIIGIAIGSLVLLGMVLPYFISVDSFRPKITSMIEQKTGRKVAIGNIRARFIPHIGFTVTDIALSSPESFGNVSLLKADSLKGALAWGPLFRGEYQIDSLELVHPVLFIADDEHGRSNYDFSPEAVTPGARKNLADSGKPLELSSVDLSNAELTFCRIVGAHHTLVPAMKITGVDVHLSDITTQPGALKLWSARVPLSGVKMELSGMRGPLAFKSGELNLKDGHLDGTFEGEVGSALKAKGQLHVLNIEKPVADVEISMPLLDLDQLAGANSTSAPAGRAASAAPGRGDLVADIKAKAERVRYSSYEGTGAHAEIKVYDNRTEGPLTMAFYGGSLGVSVRIDSAQTPSRFSANLQLSQVDMEKLLSVDPGTKGKMTGHGEVKLQLLGTLDKNPLSSLSGEGNFALHDGRLPGVNLGKSMKELSQIEQVLNLGQSGGKGGETTYSLIAGDLSIRSARLFTNRTHAETNMGSGDIRGSIGIDNTLDMTGQWSLLPDAGGGAANPAGILGSVFGQVTNKKGGTLSVPFIVRGTLKDPKMTPGGVPTMKGGTSSTPTPQQPQKKSIFDIFKKP